MSEAGPRVKICGHVRRDDVLASDALGADYLGVVLSAGFSRSVEPSDAARLVEGVGTARVAVLVDEDAAGAASRARSLGAEVVQLHGDEAPELLRALHGEGPWRLWKAVRAAELDDVERALERYGEVADGLLVEGVRPGVVGGGGARLHVDPEALRALVPERLELILAGGLSPENVAEAIRAARPDVVDVSSGVEASPGRKSAERVERFIAEARGVGAVR